MRYARIALTIAMVSILSGGAALAEEKTWPSDQEAELKRLEVELLDCQKQRFAALFSNDESSVKRLSERFAELQKQRRELLEATGQI